MLEALRPELEALRPELEALPPPEKEQLAALMATLRDHAALIEHPAIADILVFQTVGGETSYPYVCMSIRLLTHSAPLGLDIWACFERIHAGLARTIRQSHDLPFTWWGRLLLLLRPHQTLEGQFAHGPIEGPWEVALLEWHRIPTRPVLEGTQRELLTTLGWEEVGKKHGT